MALFNEYSPKDVHISWNGIPIQGFADDSFIRLSRNTDLIEHEVGARGDVSLTKIADRTGTVEIELMQTAPSNFALATLALEQEGNIGITNVSNLLIRDPSGSVLATALNAWLQKLPDIELGMSQNTRTWIFGCERLEYTVTPDVL